MGHITLRRSEWVLSVYFVYVAVLARILPVKEPVPAVTLWLNFTILAVYGLAAYADSLRRRRFLGAVRDWYPTVLIVLAYREMGWLASASHNYSLEHTWVVWDKFFLHNLGVKALIESAGPVLPSVLEIS